MSSGCRGSSLRKGHRQGMSKGHSFGFTGLHPTFCPFLDLEACSRSALDGDKLPQQGLGPCHVLPSIPGPRQGCKRPRPAGTTRYASTGRQPGQCSGLGSTRHSCRDFFPLRPFFRFLSLSLFLLWFNNRLFTGKNKVQPPAEMELSPLQSVLPGHPLLEQENSLQTVHRDRASSRGSRPPLPVTGWPCRGGEH